MEKADLVTTFLSQQNCKSNVGDENISCLMDITFNDVEVLRQGRLARPRNRSSQKLMNRMQKARPVVNPDDRCEGFFFLEPPSLDVMKRLVNGKVQSKSRLNSYCEEQARFQYYFTLRNMSFARRHAQKKPAGAAGSGDFSCSVCDDHFLTEDKLQEHSGTNRHYETQMIYESLKPVLTEWYELKINPDYKLCASVIRSEVEGIKVNTGDRLRTQEIQKRKQSDTAADVRRVRLNDSVFARLDAKNLPLKKFILAAYDKVMEVHWPTPQTKFYCRCCNYESFETQELLDSHKETEKHLEQKDKFMEAWCVTCQIHTGNANGYDSHLKTPRHLMIKQLLDDTNKRAVAFWNKVNQVKNGVSAVKRNGDTNVIQEPYQTLWNPINPINPAYRDYGGTHNGPYGGLTDPFLDPYRTSINGSLHGSHATTLFVPDCYTGYAHLNNKKLGQNGFHDDFMECSHFRSFDPPQKKANTQGQKFGDDLSNSISYPKPKKKEYLADGRRKLPKSKVERDRERMTKFIQKKAGLKLAEKKVEEAPKTST